MSESVNGWIKSDFDFFPGVKYVTMNTMGGGDDKKTEKKEFTRQASQQGERKRKGLKRWGCSMKRERERERTEDAIQVMRL